MAVSDMTLATCFKFTVDARASKACLLAGKHLKLMVMVYDIYH